MQKLNVSNKAITEIIGSGALLNVNERKEIATYKNGNKSK